MKIDDSRKKLVRGDTLSSFVLGDCVRLVGMESGFGEPFIGHIYVVSRFNRHLLAVNLSDGCHRETGEFVLEPTAKVVIE